MSYIKGVPYIVLWFASIFAGYAVFFCPLLPLMLVSNKWYRNTTDFLLTFWQLYPSALLYFIYGCDIHVTGDAINSDENILVIMNHRTRTDWNYLWPAVSKATFGRNRWMYPTKFVLKDPIRHVPGVGWMMQLGSYVYIKRHWEEDQVKMSRAIDFFADLGSKYSLLIFPEGTDLTDQTKANSNRFADKLGLPHYEHVLHPRTTGFTFLAQKMLQTNSLDAIYDATIVYVDKIPQNEKSLINGNIPKEICIHFKRYTNMDFGSTELSLKNFLEVRWSEKERAIADFLSSDRRTLYDSKTEIKVRPYHRNLMVAFVFWTMLPFPVVYALCTSPAFRYVVVAHTLFLLATNFVSDGFQSFEIGVHDGRRGLHRLLFHAQQAQVGN